MSTPDVQSPVELADVVANWLVRQRWFAGKSREIVDIKARLLAPLPGTGQEVELWLVDVTYAGEDRETYQVPLVRRESFDDSLAHALVGQLGSVYCYDALWDKAATPAWLRGIASGRGEPPLRFVLTADAKDIPVDATSLVLGGEQSNTSAVFGDAAILKVFRRLDVGHNPDIEIHEALTYAGARHIARLLGYLEAQTERGPVSLAMLQEYLTTATNGWELAKISVRDLMAEDDLHADEVGGDFAGEAFRLGHTTASMHAELAAAFGMTELSADEMTERATRMERRLDIALAEVPELAEVEAGLRRSYRMFAGTAPLTVQRIHGDLHLGQVLRTSQRWVFLDFEGEPAKSIEERRALDSPLRDVAGMLRSFDYAANHQVIDSSPTPRATEHADEWAIRNRSAFCAGYADVSGRDPDEDADVLAAYEADKAVYETVYEARNRPSWLPVPVASLGRIANREVVTEEEHS
jgi:maltokinase